MGRKMENGKQNRNFFQHLKMKMFVLQRFVIVVAAAVVVVLATVAIYRIF